MHKLYTVFLFVVVVAIIVVVVAMMFIVVTMIIFGVLSMAVIVARMADKFVRNSGRATHKNHAKQQYNRLNISLLSFRLAVNRWYNIARSNVDEEARHHRK